MNSEFDINKIGAEIIKNYASGISAPLRKKLKKAWLKHKYGCTVSETEAESLKKIAQSGVYKDLKLCLGNHWAHSLIKVGLLLSRLDIKGRTERSKKLADEAYSKEGPKGRRIIHLAHTGILIPVINYIRDLKYRKKASIITLNQEFDSILNRWDSIAIPINRSQEERDIAKKIKRLMKVKPPLFFVYAAGKVASKATSAISNMNNKDLFHNKYLFFNKIDRFEGIIYCLWIFEKVGDLGESPFYNITDT